jgi:selenide,water dikinase
LLVGNDSRDDAAVYDMGNGIGIISTIDFFMPIVGNPFDFGRKVAPLEGVKALTDVTGFGLLGHLTLTWFNGKTE